MHKAIRKHRENGGAEVGSFFATFTLLSCGCALLAATFGTVPLVWKGMLDADAGDMELFCF